MSRGIYVGLITALVTALSTVPSCSQPSNPWTVVSVRERRAGEVPFEKASRYLWPSPDANNVPGPDSLVARVRIDEEYHPHVVVEDFRTGKIVPLLESYASGPHWSPDGKYIGCVVWKSPGQNAELTVVDVPGRTMLLDPDVRASGSTMKWSPDSRTLAADGVIYGGPRTILYTLSVPEGSVTVLDTLDVLSDYEFSWSPDGRWIAFSRPTELHHISEDPVAADLWIADPGTGETWPVLETPDFVESNPLWITNRTIQIDRVRWAGDERGVEQCVVIELSKEDSRRTQN